MRAQTGPAQFVLPPINSETGKAIRTSNLAGAFIGCFRTKNFKNSGEQGAWAYPRTALPKFFGHPLLSQERKKLRTSHYSRIFTGSIGTKSNEKFYEKQPGRSQAVPKIFRAPIGYRPIGRIARSSLRQHSFLVANSRCCFWLSFELKRDQKSSLQKACRYKTHCS